MRSPVPGSIIYAGLGCGMPEHITLRASNALAAADTIVIDAPPHARLRTLARDEAEWVVVGAQPDRPALASSEIQKLLTGRAKGGKTVVRLVEGDPAFFEGVVAESALLAKAGLEVELVPGVSSLAAAASCAGVPVHDGPGKSPLAIIWGPDEEDAARWVEFVRSGGVVAVLDPLPRLKRIVADLVEAGAPGALPCVAVSRAGSPAQRRITSGLDAFPGAVEQADLAAPTIVFIGTPVKERNLIPDHRARPLAGKRLVLTRTREQAGEWAPRLEALGAEVIELPLIQVTYTVDPHTLAEVFGELGSYEWLVFTSANGVRGFMKAFFRAYNDIRSLGFIRIAAVGEGTAAALKAWHLTPELVPEKSDGDGLAKALAASATLDSARILVAVGNLNRDDLVRALEDGRAIVDRLPVYETTNTDLARERGAAQFRAHGADAILFTSSSAVRSFIDQAAHLQLEPGAVQPVAASIGPMTSATLREFKMPIAAEASEPTLDALVNALVKAFAKR